MKDTIENNGAMFCAEHAPKAGNYSHLKPEFFVGKFVKKAFPVEDNPKVRVEHMWVEIEKVDGNELIGSLANDPWFIPKNVLKFEDEVHMLVEDVEDVDGLQ